MIRRRAAVRLLPALLAWAATGLASEPALRSHEVYRSEHITIRTEVPAAGSGTLRIGDVVSLLVTVSFDGNAVAVPENEAVRVTGSGPESGLVLLDRESSHRPGATHASDRHLVRFSLQILACPGGAPTCRGNRRYELPELTLEYRLHGSGAPAAITFRPEPRVLSVRSAITLDSAGGLHPFSAYFPEGGWPDPVIAPDRIRLSLAAAGSGLLMLIGGFLMWPFRLRANGSRQPAELPRWREQLREIEDGGEDDHFRQAERMRRCLVWYVSDELRLDPLDWIETPETGERPQEHGELRALFVDLLHDPSGRCDELRARLVLLLPGAP